MEKQPKCSSFLFFLFLFLSFLWCDFALTSVVGSKRYQASAHVHYTGLNIATAPCFLSMEDKFQWKSLANRETKALDWKFLSLTPFTTISFQKRKVKFNLIELIREKADKADLKTCI